MICSYDRYMREHRNYRLEARLSSRETDNRNPEDMVGYVATIVLPKREDSSR